MTKEYFVEAIKKRVDRFGGTVSFYELVAPVATPTSSSNVYRQRANRVDGKASYTLRGSILGIFLRDISDEEYNVLGIEKGKLSGKISTIMHYIKEAGLPTDYKTYTTDKLVYTTSFGDINEFNIIKFQPHSFWTDEDGRGEPLGLYIYLAPLKVE